MKATKNNRMVISYIPKELHNDIRKWCINEGVSLHKWAELAQKSLSGKA